MIKYLKKLRKRCFSGVGYSGTKTKVEVVKHTPTDVPILMVQPKPTHCAKHNRFKKSCFACAEVTK